ncbi:hypothetical protein ACSV5K_09230 [Agrobacterium pusense]|uniref:hypothetical protein n=1 Tax=Agrobacterium pusense TaxID=648995 RepID=UPI003FD2E840
MITAADPVNAAVGRISRRNPDFAYRRVYKITIATLGRTNVATRCHYPCRIRGGKMFAVSTMRKAITMQTASKPRETTAPIMLRGGRVTGSFKAELMDAAARAGMSANEFVMRAAAEKLQANGRIFSGLFWPGDLKEGTQ